MKHLLICLSFVLALTTGASAQYVSDEQAKKSAEITAKMRQVDLLNQMLPLVMKKEQIEKLLPVIEKARQKVKDQEKAEYALMLQYDTKLDAAIKAGVEKGALPDTQLIRDLNKMALAMDIGRSVVINDNASAVMAAMKATLNAGQLKAAEGALNPRLFDPSIKVDEMTDDQKLSFFVRNIMLDPLGYDILRELSKHAS